jgi:hypothetical protein
VETLWIVAGYTQSIVPNVEQFGQWGSCDTREARINRKSRHALGETKELPGLTKSIQATQTGDGFASPREAGGA